MAGAARLVRALGRQARAVVDAATLAVLATPFYLHDIDPPLLVQIMPGPAGQVTLRIKATILGPPADSVWLFTSPALK